MNNATMRRMAALIMVILAVGAARADDVGVSAIISPPTQLVLNTPYSLKSAVFNFSPDPVTFDAVFYVYMQDSPTALVADTVTLNMLPAGVIDTVTFTDMFTPTVDTSYLLISYTTLAGDEDNSNDTTQVMASVFSGVIVWYGHVDGTPLQGNINSRFNVDAFAMTTEDVYAGDAHLCLGTNDSYIDSLLSNTEGTQYYPFTDWDFHTFSQPYGSPPNPIGWSSQSFSGIARTNSQSDSPWLHLSTPTQVLTYVVKAANDSSLIGSTVNAIGPGISPLQGPSNAGDTLGLSFYPVLEFFSPFYFRGAGTVTGTVTDEFSAPIQDVIVTDLATSKSDTTSSSGMYTIANLFPGLHDISFSHPNHRDTVVADVNVPPNGTTTLNVQMQPLPFHDAGVTAILSPPRFVQLNTSYPLRSEVANFGTATSTIDVTFEAYVLGDVTPLISETKTLVDMPGNSLDTIEFDQELLTTLDTTYYLVSYTELVEDIDPSNDTTTALSSIFFGVSAWYGRLDDEPLDGVIGERLPVDVYIQTIESIYLSKIHLCLGTANQYIDSLLSKYEGQIYYPFTEWDIAQFSLPYGSPPNAEGWSSQSFIGFASLGSNFNPWLHSETPTKSLTFMVKIVNDPQLVSDTITCFGTGLSPTFGPSNASDTLASQEYPIIELFSKVEFKSVGYIAGTITDPMFEPISDVFVSAMGTGHTDSSDVAGQYFLDSLEVGTYDIFFTHPNYHDTIATGIEVLQGQVTTLDMIMTFPCDFVPGDANGDGMVLGGDVSFMVRYFAGEGSHPPDSCFDNVADDWLYSAADANGDCLFLPGDISYMVQFFGGTGPWPTYCPRTPPSSLISVLPGKEKIPISDDRENISMEDKR